MKKAGPSPCSSTASRPRRAPGGGSARGSRRTAGVPSRWTCAARREPQDARRRTSRRPRRGPPRDGVEEPGCRRPARPLPGSSGRHARAQEPGGAGARAPGSRSTDFGEVARRRWHAVLPGDLPKRRCSFSCRDPTWPREDAEQRRRVARLASQSPGSFGTVARPRRWSPPSRYHPARARERGARLMLQPRARGVAARGGH